MKNIVLFLFFLYNLLTLVKSLEYSYLNYYSYSNNKKYSEYFLSNANIKSNHFSYGYSNYFDSKYFINSKKISLEFNSLSKSYVSFGYLSIIKTMSLKCISVYQYSKSHNSFNPYLSIIRSIPSQSMLSIYYSSYIPTHFPTFNPTPIPTFITTFNPTLNPTPITTLNPTPITTLNPTPISTTFNTNFNPTFIPTKNPTIIEVPVIVFDTKLSFNNYDTIELDNKSQQVIILATANSMNISASYVEYIGSSLKTRRKLFIFRLLGFNIIVTLKTTIPLQGNTDPKLLYSTLTTNLINSVNSGLFTTYLITASNILGITSFANVSILSVQNDDYIIQEPDKPYINEKETPYNYNTIYIIFGVLLSVYLILFFIWFRKKYYNRITRIRNLLENMINTDDISIRIVEN